MLVKRINILVVSPIVNNEHLLDGIKALHRATSGSIVYRTSVDTAIEEAGRAKEPFHVLVIDDSYGKHSLPSVEKLINEVNKKAANLATSPFIVETKEAERETSPWATHRMGTQKFIRDFSELCTSDQ